MTPHAYYGEITTPPWFPAYRGRAGISRAGMRPDTCAAQIMAYGYTLNEAVTIMRDAERSPYKVAEPRRYLTVGAPCGTVCPGWSVSSTVGPAVVRAWNTA